MWVKRFKVKNFSSFSDSGWIDLDRSVNLFIGQNNSGKSALLKALNFPLTENPHKSPRAFRGQDLQSPLLEFDVQITSGELLHRLSLLGVNFLHVAAADGQQHRINDLMRLLGNKEEILNLEFQRGPNSDTASRGGSAMAPFRVASNLNIMQLRAVGGELTLHGRTGDPENLGKIISGSDSSSFFYFDAQRLNIARSTWDSPQRLRSNAANLAAVLAYLQGSRRPVFDLIERHVINVLGGIDRITVAPRQNEHEILLWPDRSAMYEELAFSLDDSGTGVGQVLAIITAMVTSEQSVFLVDEINSFIHPAAVKKLLALMRAEYNHHQYIISTHSADVIANASAEILYRVNRDAFESNVERISLQDTRQAREVSSALGFSMMDVFGYERLVWVEGPTEETCFPYLARRRGLLNKPGIGFAPVHSTGTIACRNASRSAIQVYEQAGKRLAPLLKGMAFALDRETLSDAEVAKLERSRRKLRFLPRRCLECYLINPEAITKVLTELDNREHAVAEIVTALQAGSGQQFGAPRQWTGDLTDPLWLKRVDGAKLLSHVFSSVTNNRVEYRKTRDGITLLRAIADDDPDSIRDLDDFVAKVVDIAERDTAP